MQVKVHFTIGAKELTFKGDAPLFDPDPGAAHRYRELGFFLFNWRDVEKTERPHPEWCFIPWLSCWVEKVKDE